MRSRYVVLAALLLMLAWGGAAALADTATFRDGRDPVGGHDITRLRVDNTGDRVGVTVTHRRAGWRGAVRLALDVGGDRRADYVAVVGRGRGARDTFERADGRPWRCADRRAASRMSRTTTVLTFTRRCADRVPSLQVKVAATSPDRRPDLASSPVVPQQSRPNVVMIMVDDMRADDLVYMPWTRRLVGDRGATFRNSFSPYPLCCPARASVLTGRYSHNHGVLHVRPPYGFSSFDDRSTLATWLLGAGYATVYVGKYLNGYGQHPEPGQTTGKSIYYVPPGWSEWRASLDGGLGPAHPDSGGTYKYFDTTLSRHGRGFVNYEGRYQSRVYGALTERLLRSRAASARPFFLYVSYTAPHNGGPVEPDDPGVLTRSDGQIYTMGTPARPADVQGLFDAQILEAPGADWVDPDWSDKPAYLAAPEPTEPELTAMRDLTRQRAEALWVVDQQVRRTVETLESTGELEETLVVFTSDNGYFLGEQRKRQGKTEPHEPSLRVPLLVRGPGIPPGVVRDDPFLSIDVAPTIADLAGVTVPDDVDGLSMLSVARTGDRGWRRAVLTQAAELESGTEARSNGVRTSRYLYVRQSSGEEELYDLAIDPQQYANLATDRAYADELALLRAELDRMRSCRAHACRAPMAEALTSRP